MCHSIIRLHPDCQLELGDGLFHLVLFEEGRTEVCVGDGIIGFESNRMPEFSDGLFQLPLIAQGSSEVFVELGVLGLEPDRSFALCNCVIQLPLLAQGDAEVGVGDTSSWILSCARGIGDRAS